MKCLEHEEQYEKGQDQEKSAGHYHGVDDPERKEKHGYKGREYGDPDVEGLLTDQEYQNARKGAHEGEDDPQVQGIPSQERLYHGYERGQEGRPVKQGVTEVTDLMGGGVICKRIRAREPLGPDAGNAFQKAEIIEQSDREGQDENGQEKPSFILDDE